MQLLSEHIGITRALLSARLQGHGLDGKTHLPYYNDGSAYAGMLREYELSNEECWLVLLGLIPHIMVGFFESVILEIYPQGGELPELGGVKGVNHRGMIPTGETAQYLLAGNDLSQRIEVSRYFSSESRLIKKQMLALESVKEGEPFMSGKMILAPEIVEKCLYGQEMPPAFGPDFPAKRSQTTMKWQDLVLHPATQDQIKDIRTWLRHFSELSADEVLTRKMRRGFKALFYGPPGTGKTLTSTLLGKEFGKEVYRIDLSQVVSKYIGETEKNLEKIFARAEHKDWILFFDEADALFGKRSAVSSSNDRYANQEVSYLLQRVEDHPGLIILASNFKNNIDQAFLRRFNAVLHFPMPDPVERLNIWQKNLPATIPLEQMVDLKKLADKYELSGAAIANVIQYASLKAVARTTRTIEADDLQIGIRKELSKESKI